MVSHKKNRCLISSVTNERLRKKQVDRYWVDIEIQNNIDAALEFSDILTGHHHHDSDSLKLFR